MPKGDNPNSRANLAKGKATQFNGETAAKSGRKGAEASNKKQAENKKDQERLDLFFDVLERKLKIKITANGKEIQTWDGLGTALVKKGLQGDLKALELILKIMGQMPSDKVESLVINAPDTDLNKIKEIRKLLQDDK